MATDSTDRQVRKLSRRCHQRCSDSTISVENKWLCMLPVGAQGCGNPLAPSAQQVRDTFVYSEDAGIEEPQRRRPHFVSSGLALGFRLAVQVLDVPAAWSLVVSASASSPRRRERTSRRGPKGRSM